MPAFFVPQVEADLMEECYQQIAGLFNVTAPPPADRIFSITWTHDSVEWTATVGQQLKGFATITKGRGRDQRISRVARSTSDTVLAIFAGVPFQIAHDNHSRIWNMPIYAGSPSTVVRFPARSLMSNPCRRHCARVTGDRRLAPRQAYRWIGSETPW